MSIKRAEDPRVRHKRENYAWLSAQLDSLDAELYEYTDRYGLYFVRNLNRSPVSQLQSRGNPRWIVGIWAVENWSDLDVSPDPPFQVGVSISYWPEQGYRHFRSEITFASAPLSLIRAQLPYLVVEGLKKARSWGTPEPVGDQQNNRTDGWMVVRFPDRLRDRRPQGQNPPADLMDT